MRKLFVSYARENRVIVNELVGHLNALGHELWVDAALRGGQSWWDEIVQRISECDVFVAIVSTHTLNSVACQRELEWAIQTNRSVLPVAVEHLSEALPRQLSTRHVVDYSHPGQAAAFALAGALANLPPALPPPEQLPEPPAAPLSYLTDLVDQILQTTTMSKEIQHRILGQAGSGLRSRDPEERDGARQILEMLWSREDLFADVDRALQHMLGSAAKGAGRGDAAGAWLNRLKRPGKDASPPSPAAPKPVVRESRFEPPAQQKPKSSAGALTDSAHTHHTDPKRKRRMRYAATTAAAMAIIAVVAVFTIGGAEEPAPSAQVAGDDDAGQATGQEAVTPDTAQQLPQPLPTSARQTETAAVSSELPSSSPLPTAQSSGVATAPPNVDGRTATIADYVQQYGITETDTRPGEVGAPRIDFDFGNSGLVAAEPVPEGAFAAFTDESGATLTAALSALTGNADPGMILELAPGRVWELPYFDAGQEGNFTIDDEYPAKWIVGTYGQDATDITFMAVTIPKQDGLFLLELTSQCSENTSSRCPGPSQLRSGVTITPS